MQVTTMIPQRNAETSSACEKPGTSFLDAQANSPVAMAALRSLEASSYKLLKQIKCEEREGALLLRGTVPSYFLKQMAQTVVQGVPGVLEISNRIDVTSTSSSR